MRMMENKLFESFEEWEKEFTPGVEKIRKQNEIKEDAEKYASFLANESLNSVFDEIKF
jgi:hypothetical protein